MYRQGLWPETPEHFKNPEDFHKMIRRWKKIEDANGPWALKTKTKKFPELESISFQMGRAY